MERRQEWRNGLCVGRGVNLDAHPPASCSWAVDVAVFERMLFVLAPDLGGKMCAKGHVNALEVVGVSQGTVALRCACLPYSKWTILMNQDWGKKDSGWSGGVYSLNEPCGENHQMLAVDLSAESLERVSRKGTVLGG